VLAALLVIEQPTSNMNIFQEITESRMIRTLRDVEDKTLGGLMERLYEHLLALEVLAIEMPQEAAKYAQSIVQNIQLNGFRQSQNDLYNLLVFLINQDQYKDQVKKDIEIQLPEFRLKRNLREIANGRIDINDFNNMMMVIQRTYSTIGGRQANLRREISNYQNLNKTDRQRTVNQLLMVMREYKINSDMYLLMEKVLRKLL